MATVWPIVTVLHLSMMGLTYRSSGIYFSSLIAFIIYSIKSNDNGQQTTPFQRQTPDAARSRCRGSAVFDMGFYVAINKAN